MGGLGKGVKRYLVFVFAVPLIMAFTVSLTPDITVNHKFVMMAEMLLSVFPAMIIAGLWEKRNTLFQDGLIMRRITAGVLIVLLTITGFFEYLIVQRQYQAVYDPQDPRTVWFKENTDSQDVILTAPYALNEVVLGGAMLYYGHAYYAMSAGYDTYTREEYVKQMYEASTPERLDRLVKEHGITHIVVDKDARDSYYFTVQERVIAATYEEVFSYGEDEYRFIVYDTSKRIQR